MSDVFQDRWMRPIVINAGLDKIAREERVEESVEEVFGELASRFHTVDMLKFLARTRGWTDWLTDAYKVANSTRLGHYDTTRKDNDKKKTGVAVFTKPKHSVIFHYSWKPGLEEELQDVERMAAALLGGFRGGQELVQMALRGEGVFREKFCQREYRLVKTTLEKRRLVEVAPAGIFLWSYNKKERKVVYGSP